MDSTERRYVDLKTEQARLGREADETAEALRATGHDVDRLDRLAEILKDAGYIPKSFKDVYGLEFFDKSQIRSSIEPIVPRKEHPLTEYKQPFLDAKKTSVNPSVTAVLGRDGQWHIFDVLPLINYSSEPIDVFYFNKEKPLYKSSPLNTEFDPTILPPIDETLIQRFVSDDWPGTYQNFPISKETDEKWFMSGKDDDSPPFEFTKRSRRD